jgi:hypothetical protein
MLRMITMPALAVTLLVSGCVVVDPGQPRYAYGGGGYYSAYGGGAYYAAPPVRFFGPTYYAPPPPRVIVVRERPYRSKSYRRSHGQGADGH